MKPSRMAALGQASSMPSAAQNTPNTAAAIPSMPISCTFQLFMVWFI